MVPIRCAPFATEPGECHGERRAFAATLGVWFVLRRRSRSELSPVDQGNVQVGGMGYEDTRPYPDFENPAVSELATSSKRDGPVELGAGDVFWCKR